MVFALVSSLPLLSYSLRRWSTSILTFSHIDWHLDMYVAGMKVRWIISDRVSQWPSCGVSYWSRAHEGSRANSRWAAQQRVTDVFSGSYCCFQTPGISFALLTILWPQISYNELLLRLLLEISVIIFSTQYYSGFPVLAPYDLPNARFGVGMYALLNLASFQFLSCSFDSWAVPPWPSWPATCFVDHEAHCWIFDFVWTHFGNVCFGLFVLHTDRLNLLYIWLCFTDFPHMFITH